MKERLKQRRKGLGLSLQAVGVKCGSSKSYIWELENNDILKPSATKLADIAEVLKTTVDYLLTGNEVGITEQRLLNVYAQLYLHNKVLLLEIADTLLRNQGEASVSGKERV